MISKVLLSLLSLSLLQATIATLNIGRQNALLANTKDFNLREFPRNRNSTQAAVASIRKRFKSCQVSVCFAMDGSASITAENYDYQREFVALVSAILGGYTGVKVGVVEYGGITSPVVELGPVTQQAVRNISTDESSQAILTFVGPAIGSCETQFTSNPMAQQRVVVIGDGKSTLGDIGVLGNTPFGGVQIAKNFVKNMPGNKVFAIIVSEDNVPGKIDFFLEVVQGKRANLFGAPIWRRLPDILENLLGRICTVNSTA